MINNKEQKNIKNNNFINKVELKFGKNKYSFQNLNYINQYRKITIKCLKCNKNLNITPKVFLSSKHGCVNCYNPTYAKRIKKRTTESFINELKLIFFDKDLDYSLINYKNTLTPVSIKCNVCRNIKIVRPINLLRSKIHCDFCINKINSYQSKEIKKEIFIKKSQEIHNNKYDYSKFEYKSYYTKSYIKCPINGHEYFLQSPENHIKGNGCPLCGKSVQRKSKTDFICEALTIHPKGSFDYSKINYKNALKKIKIKCLNCKNFFEQTPQKHLQMKNHCCPKCSGNIPKELVSFIEISKNKFKNQFDYSFVDFKTMVDKITLICTICNNKKIEVTPATHLKTITGGCNSCLNKFKLIKNTNTFLKKAKNKNKDKIDYSYVDYVDNKTNIKLFCNIGKHFFFQTPSSHISPNNSFCPICNSNGFNKNKSAILYYISIDNGRAYKIGVTNNSIENRYSSKLLKRITILKQWFFQDGEEAYKTEQSILKEYTYAKWKGEDLLNTGKTELFDRDILLLDNF